MALLRANQPVAPTLAQQNLLLDHGAAQAGGIIMEWLEDVVDLALVVQTPPLEDLCQFFQDEAPLRTIFGDAHQPSILEEDAQDSLASLLSGGQRKMVIGKERFPQMLNTLGIEGVRHCVLK
jgi:hypothetical protein